MCPSTLSTQPLYILRKALQHLANERIVAPEYSTLQDTVGRAVTHERNRVTGLLEKAMTPPVRDSNEFRRFEDDLISDTRWAQREAVLQEICAPLLLAPIEDTLQTLREALETRFAQVNQRITEATNLFGTFEFNDTPTKVDIDALVALFADARYWTKRSRTSRTYPNTVRLDVFW